VAQPSRRRHILRRGADRLMVTSPLLIIVAFLFIGCAHAPLKRDQPPLSVTLRWNLSDTNPPPLIASDDPPHSIVIRWAPLVISAADVERLAERHCLA
jgi:hypothetical protein